ncbi:MAG: hypothetical protein C6H99_06570 [Epsilonproteobacteria bacterium]|nr:hypothetical protein [Campylobacterota bacterium]NPA63435.1 ComF family protein [Campylobacterota bacterium]
MRCLLCWRFSWSHICKECRRSYLRPKIRTRKLESGFEVVSFYGYKEIEDLLLSKYHYIGAKIYAILAKEALRPFARALELWAWVIPIDDRVDPYYSHTAILAKGMATKTLRPKYGQLRAKNRVRYSGMSLEFRKSHPRDFVYKGRSGDLILVDDIITTGLTIQEAVKAAQTRGANPLFGVVLADARY